jgi:hypothetical protein
MSGYMIDLLKTQCRECGRWFDLLDEEEAGEWEHGHDCEEVHE